MTTCVCSLGSKRFRLVLEQRKTEERDSRFWPREKWNESQKMKEALLLSPFDSRSWTARKRLLRRLVCMGKSLLFNSFSMRLPPTNALYSLWNRINRATDSLPADVLWGSFVTHSFLPHRGGEMNAWQINPKGGIYFMVESHKCTGSIHSVYYVVLCLLPNS